MCGVNQEVTFPGAYFIDMGYLALLLLLVILGMFGPLIGLCCIRRAKKGNRLLNEGAQKSTIPFLIELVFFGVVLTPMLSFSFGNNP